MVDHELRKKLSEFIQQYLDLEIDSDEFVNGLTELYDIGTKDNAVKLWPHVCWESCGLYGKDIMPRSDWNFFQRSILFFKTELPIGGFNKVTIHKFDASQILAGTIAAAQIASLVSAFTFRSELLLLVFAVLLICGTSICRYIAKQRSEIEENFGVDIQQEISENFNLNLYPFVSRDDMYKAIKATQFKKPPYPASMEEPFDPPYNPKPQDDRKNPFVSFIMTTVLSPIILFIYAIWPISYETIETVESSCSQFVR